MATQVYLTKDHVKQEQIMDLQVSTNTVVHAVNQIHEKVVDVRYRLIQPYMRFLLNLKQVRKT